jgi:hypothetical protein
MQIDNTPIPQEQTVVVKAVKLRAGSKVVARVVKAPGPDGRGSLALGGAVVRAKLPAGVRAGQRLQLLVMAQSGNQVVFRMAREAACGKRPLPARLAAALAEKGDGELLRAAAQLSGGVIPLPGRRVVQLEEQESDEDEGGSEPGSASRLCLTLHTAELGALTVYLGLAAGVLEAEIVVDGDVLERAHGALPQLTTAIESSTGLPVVVRLQRRKGSPPPVPEPDLVEGERYA